MSLGNLDKTRVLDVLYLAKFADSLNSKQRWIQRAIDILEEKKYDQQHG